jgi:hypothetical protein
MRTMILHADAVLEPSATIRALRASENDCL